MAASGPRYFVSYRREDASGHAGRLADHLLDRFGQGAVFVDVDSIEAGSDFTAEIGRAISGSDAVLVVIGLGWLDAATSSGTRRLDEPADFVRQEIEAALSSAVRVIPVLVGGAQMPAEADLPSSIAALSHRNAVELQDRRWREDVDALVDVLEGRGRATLGNLPPQPTPFLGRETELAELTDLLRRADVRLVTLTGPGGIGKTRLAMQVAAELTHAYPAGAWFVGLAALTDPALVLVEIARVLEVQEPGEGNLLDALAARLSRTRTLIVLDNLEQLLPEAAASIARLSSAAASLDLVVTSRQLLHLTAEREYALGTLEEDTAISLFIERAQASGGDLALADVTHRETIAAVCARLEGLPLAIQLAAARTKLLDLHAMLGRLEQRLAFLTGGARDLPARQQTLRATIDWSYELLPTADQRLFARLSIFAGGWTLDAAEAVCADEALDVLAGLESLARNSLIERRSSGSHPRSAMLETVREYAAELLQDGAELEEISSRHAEFFVSIAELGSAELKGPHPERWFERLEPELGNFRVAIQWALAGERMSLALRLTASLLASLVPCGYWQEARAIGLEDVLARTAGLHTAERAQVLVEAGYMYLSRGQMTTSQEMLEEAVELAEEVGDQRTRALAMGRLTWCRSSQGVDDEASRTMGEEAVRLARSLDDPWLLAETLNDLSGVYGEHTYSARAGELMEESLRLRRAIAFVPGVADSLNNLGWQSLLSQDYGQAIAYLHECLDLARDFRARAQVIMAQDNLALAYLFNDEPERAERLFRENLLLCRHNDDRRIGAEALLGLAGTATQMRSWSRAAWLEGAAMALYAELNLVSTGIDLRIRERYLPAVREVLGDDGFAEAFEQGGRASFEEAVAFALDEVAST